MVESMDYSFEATDVDIENLAWLEKQLDPIWVANSKEMEHPLIRVFRTYHNHEPYKKYDILLSHDIPRTLAFAKITRALSQFPTRRRNGMVISDHFFCNQLINRAKQSVAEFDATEIEATVAWAYFSILKQPINAIEAGETPTPDFEITINGLHVFVECKARNIITPLHRQIDITRSEIVEHVGALFKRVTVNYGICISTDQIPDRTEIPNLVKTVESLSSSGQAFSCSIGHFKVEAIILLPNDQEIITPTLEPLGQAKHVPEPIRSFMIRNGVSDPVTYSGVHYEFQKREGKNLICIKNPKVLIVHFAIIPNHIKAVSKLIRAGRKQLPSNATNLIIIRAPDFYVSNQFFNLGLSISKTLKFTSRISGVILWHQAIQTKKISLDEWDQTLRWQLYCIRNKNARNPLPPSFELNHLPRGRGFQVLNRS